MRTRLHKVRGYWSPYGFSRPLIPRWINLALRGGRRAYPLWFYKWHDRMFVPLYSEKGLLRMSNDE